MKRRKPKMKQKLGRLLEHKLFKWLVVMKLILWLLKKLYLNNRIRTSKPSHKKTKARAMKIVQEQLSVLS